MGSMIWCARSYPRAADLGVDALMEKPLDIPLFTTVRLRF